MAFWPVAKQVIGESDIVLLVVDARMPELSRNADLDRILFRTMKEVIIVFNKADLVSRVRIDELRAEYKGAYFVCAPKNIGVSTLRKGIMILGKKMGLEVIKVGVVGYPNVGKSALINALAHRARTLVAQQAGTTKGTQFVRAGKLKIIDSPGVIPFEDKENKLAMIGAKDPERIHNVEKVAFDVIRQLLVKNRKALEEYAGVSIDNMGEEEIFETIGRNKGFLAPGGVVNEKKTAIHLVRDWQKGKLRI